MTIQAKTTLHWLIASLALGCMLALPRPAAASGGGAAEEADIHNGPSFMVMEAVTVSIIRTGKVRGFLTVDVTLELPGSEYRQTVTKVAPRLAAAYHHSIRDIAARGVDLDQPVDINLVTDILQSVTDQVLGEELAIVLIGSASVQRR